MSKKTSGTGPFMHSHTPHRESIRENPRTEIFILLIFFLNNRGWFQYESGRSFDGKMDDREKPRVV